MARPRPKAVPKPATPPARKTGRSRASPRARPAGLGRTLLGRLRRLVLRLLLVLLLVPGALVLIFRFVPVPVTPLMLIRAEQGYGIEHDWVPLEAIAPPLRFAVIAAEDNLFCEHWGFDLRALEGEAKALLAGEDARGASTITMQTAKNLFLWPDRSFVRKALEAWLTPQLELLWPKRRILEVYLNIIEFGPGLYGAEAAASQVFGKPAAGLDYPEAALLAAVLPDPLDRSAATPSAFVQDRARTIRTRIDQLGPLLDCAR